MPHAPLKACVVPGCGQLVTRGRCPTHAAALERGRPNAAIRRLYFTKRWHLLHLAVLRDQAYACAQCGQIAPILDVHHVIDHHGNLGLFWQRSNLLGLCKVCHSTITQQHGKNHGEIHGEILG